MTAFSLLDNLGTKRANVHHSKSVKRLQREFNMLVTPGAMDTQHDCSEFASKVQKASGQSLDLKKRLALLLTALQKDLSGFSAPVH